MAASPRSADTPPGSTRARGIRRKTGPPSPLSYEGFRSEGVRRTQALSGANWTDYNLHDPGVTILEALCYALTDLVYRIGFPVADHLTGADGRIDFATLALQGPAQVFPCRPTTIADHRRALLDTVDALENAWVGADVSGSGLAADIRGLYRIALEHSEQVIDEADRAAARDAVWARYRSHRNLCEDLEDVTSIAAVDCHLEGAFEIGGARSPEDILADILDVCSRCITAGVTFRSFQSELDAGGTPDSILDAPQTRRGIISDEALRDADRDELFVGDLVAEVRKVDGVRSVGHLALRKGDDPPVTGLVRWQTQREALRLRLPSDDGLAASFRLTRAGSLAAISASEVREKYLDLRTVREAQRHGRQDIEALCPPPQGTHRDLQRYFSIQNHFPAIYGINAHGLPASATPADRAMAAQLKTYLVLFEQVIADGAAHLQHLRELFSTRSDVRRTYWSQRLDDVVPGLVAPRGSARLPGLQTLLVGRPAGALASPESRARHDEFFERRHRVLDHLLALHGETYAQNALRQLACYYAPGELDEMLLANKLAYLDDILHIGRDRAGGFDYSAASWNVAPRRDLRPSNGQTGGRRVETAGGTRRSDEDRDGAANVSGFQLRVSLLLGFRYRHSRTLVAALRDAGVEIRESTTADRDMDPLGGGKSILADEGSEALMRVPLEPPLPAGTADPEATLDAVRERCELSGLVGSQVSLALLRHGVDLANYRVGRLRDASGYALLFRADRSRRWWILGTYDTASPTVAYRAANRLRRFLVQLNVESEGMHVVEHVLLRPLHKAGVGSPPIAPTFYSLRMTVLFPAWTARGQTPGFKRLAEETVQLNCPAHVHPECLWLGFDDMAAFEKLYEHWLSEKVKACAAQSIADPHERDVRTVVADLAGRAVAAFLMRKGVQAEAGANRG